MVDIGCLINKQQTILNCIHLLYSSPIFELPINTQQICFDIFCPHHELCKSIFCFNLSYSKRYDKFFTKRIDIKNIMYSAKCYINPVIDSNNPDPSVIALTEGGYLAVATSDHVTNPATEDAFPIYYSDNLVDWELTGHVFPAGGWPQFCDRNMWAPEIHNVNGR